jgi:hypothetical protein
LPKISGNKPEGRRRFENVAVDCPNCSGLIGTVLYNRANHGKSCFRSLSKFFENRPRFALREPEEPSPLIRLRKVRIFQRSETKIWAASLQH